jgi:ubiquinone/menaquinone biosynthesis C-methylase UbiE
MYEPAGRDSWQHPARVIESLSLAPGQRVADLGAGGGYFTFLLARAVGPNGVVYAIDVDADMTGLLERRAADGNHTNVEVLLVDPVEPELPDAPLDLIFTCNTYHHIHDPAAYFARLRRHLRSGGRIAIIDHKPEGWLQRLFPHSSASETIRSEMEAAGYALQSAHDFLPKQSFLVFAPAGD